jgi:NADH-quinone oxidoreductase subunit M
LPDAHVQAPTAGSVILAGVLLKMGTYGFIRICLPMFPDATIAYMPYISVLALIAIIYGALVAMVQKDVKSLVAFSSVSHMGFVMLGIFALNMQGMEGAVIQMVNHGISTGALFLIVGMLYERRHTRLIEDFGGIAKVMPVFSAFFMIATLSSIGLPLTNGFVGEFLILIGSFQVNWLMTMIATLGVILAAVYLLYMFRRVFFGKVRHEANKGLKDLVPREEFAVLPLAVMAFVIGVFPMLFLGKLTPDSTPVVDMMQRTEERMTNEYMAEEVRLPGTELVAHVDGGAQ